MVEYLTSAQKTTVRHPMWKPLHASLPHAGHARLVWPESPTHTDAEECWTNSERQRCVAGGRGHAHSARGGRGRSRVEPGWGGGATPLVFWGLIHGRISPCVTRVRSEEVARKHRQGDYARPSNARSGNTNVEKSTQIDDVVHRFHGTGQSPHTTRRWR